MIIKGCPRAQVSYHCWVWGGPDVRSHPTPRSLFCGNPLPPGHKVATYSSALRLTLK